MKRAWYDKYKMLCINYPCEFHGYRKTEFNIASYLIDIQHINFNLDE